jgi:uncharacterized membrane protein YqjE
MTSRGYIQSMNENGSPKQGNIWKDVAEQVADHVDLASLELRFEAERATKKLVVAAAAFILVLTGFIVLQVAIVGGLMKTGLSLGLSATLLSSLYFLLAIGIYLKWGKRDRRAGQPFARTQTELRETLKWIQNILS